MEENRDGDVASVSEPEARERVETVSEVPKVKTVPRTVESGFGRLEWTEPEW